jgi:hypothetical protein
MEKACTRNAAFGVTRKINFEMAATLLQSLPIATEHLKSCHPALNPTAWVSKTYFKRLVQAL